MILNATVQHQKLPPHPHLWSNASLTTEKWLVSRDFIDHRRGDLGDPWKDRSGLKHKIPIADWKNGGECTSMEAW